MRTKVLNHFHTFHPEAQAEFNRLAAEEKRLTRAMAREPGDDGPDALRLDGTRSRRLSEPPEDLEAQLADVRAKMDEQRAIIASGVVRITIKSLARGEFRRLVTAHPPRQGDDLDASLGYNGDTFPDAFITACIVGTHAHDPKTGGNAEPVPNQWDQWADTMAEGQFEEILAACFKLTREPNPIFPR